MIKRYLDKLRTVPRVRKAFHSAHGLTHLAYFGAVWLEGHGIYAATGGALLIMGMFGMMMGDID